MQFDKNKARDLKNLWVTEKTIEDTKLNLENTTKTIPKKTFNNIENKTSNYSDANQTNDHKVIVNQESSEYLKLLEEIKTPSKEFNKNLLENHSHTRNRENPHDEENHEEILERKTTFTPSDLTNKILTARLEKKKFNIRTLILFLALLVLTIAMFFITVCIWPIYISNHINPIVSFSDGWLMQESSLPQIIVAAIGLSLGGYIVQQVTQNRLADTSILGISTVNIVLLVIVYVAGAGTTVAFSNAQPWVLMLVSIFTGLLIFALSYRKRSNVSSKFVLAGIIVNFLFVGFGNTMMNQTYANSPIFLLEPFMDGQLPLPSLTNYDFYSAIAMMLFAFVWMIFIARKFFISNTNYMIAKSLGVNPTSIYFQAIIIASIFTASAFILVGNVTFLGIATGNIAFFLFKKKPISGLFGSVLSGAFFMIFSYFIGNNCVSSTFIPPSEIIPLIVAPIFIILAIKKGR